MIMHIMHARVELFNGKGGLVEGCIQGVDRSGVDFVALEDPKFLLPQNTQWHVFAAFGEFFVFSAFLFLKKSGYLVIWDSLSLVEAAPLSFFFIFYE